MNDKTFKLLFTAIICITMLIGGMIAANIMTSQHTKDLIRFSLEKGQNPVYVKCAMESNSSNECKTMMTVIAVSKSDK